jgi:acyl-coenzyme A thioesterase 13
MLERANGIGLPNPALEGWTERAGIVSNLVGPFWERRIGSDAQVGLVCDPRHDNGNGKMHGGILMMLADMGMGAAVRATGEYPHFVTMQLDVAFLQVVDIGEFVTSECHVRHKTRSVIFVSGALKVGEKQVASAQGVFKSVNRTASR